MTPRFMAPAGVDPASEGVDTASDSPSAPLSPYLTRQPDPEAGLLLFCLHHAGGAASWFRGWQAQLGPVADVVPVQLPGRERRVHEPRMREMDLLVPELDEALDPYLSAAGSQPYALYGHSMGALIAYRLIRHRAAAGRSLPVMLLAGAHPAPQRPQELRDVPDLSEGELVEWLVRIGGLSRQLLCHPEWLQWAVSLVRDDLALCASHHPEDAGPLPCPVHVFTGSDDPLVSAAEASAWAEQSLVSCDVHVFPGGHFFPRDAGMEEFFDRLSGVLSHSALSHGALLHHRSLPGRTAP